MLTCTPFLLFDGDCAEAMTFYHDCLGGELTLTRLGDTPMKAQFPEDKHSRIINARLLGGAVDITASDWMASPALEPVRGNMSAVYIAAESDTELRPFFDALAKGASADWFQPLREVPFGTYGQFFDAYGVQWIFRGEAK